MGHVARRTARRGSGVLSALQERVARIVVALPEADGFALAGGAALVVMQVVDRATRDLDYFGPSADEVDRLLQRSSLRWVPRASTSVASASLTGSPD